jgi:hypothetical protein
MDDIFYVLHLRFVRLYKQGMFILAFKRSFPDITGFNRPYVHAGGNFLFHNKLRELARFFQVPASGVDKDH